MSDTAVAVYCGHMFSEGGEEEAALAARIAEAVARRGVSIGYGPLACGADILIAEALLARGAELNVVLPFAEDDFIAESVVCGGETWRARYQACRDAAARVYFATPGAYVGDDLQFAYNTRLAMGLAVLRADELGTGAIQLAVVSDNIASLSRSGAAGAHADVRVWRTLSRESEVIPAGPVPRKLRFPPRSPVGGGTKRLIRSMIFTDYKGFSRLGERELVQFMHEVMGRIGAVLDRFGDHVEFRNTWGDALYAVVDEPRMAARMALEMQDELDDLPPELAPPGDIAGMRIGVHYGPLWTGTDRVTGNRVFYGGEVNRTARIEPVTPVGGVYCTETFAAALKVDNCLDCVFEPVGRMSLAKNFGEVEMYRLEMPR